MITRPDDLLPDQLTERLRASGALPFGRVTAIHPEERRTMLVSTIMPLRVEYSPDAPGEIPTRLLLKSSRDGLDAGLQSIVGEREVAFYIRAAPLMPGGPLPRCYDAEYSSGRFHLLLEDLSETHMVFTEWPLPPPVEACERIVDTWAIFHAFWWRHPRLGREVGTFLDDAALARIGADYRGRYERFAETLGDRLGSRARADYARVLDARDRLFTPKRLYGTYTLAHGDAHVWNLLYPRDDVASGIYLIDWDAWRIGRGAFDLAYMMALHWYAERRARLEAPLIERYHAGLLAHGVTDYSLDQLREDYRLAVMTVANTKGRWALPRAGWRRWMGRTVTSSPILRTSHPRSRCHRAHERHPRGSSEPARVSSMLGQTHRRRQSAGGPAESARLPPRGAGRGRGGAGTRPRVREGEVREDLPDDRGIVQRGDQA